MLRPAVAVADVVLHQPLAQRRVGGVLEPAVDGRVDLVSRGVGIVTVCLFHVRPRHLRNVGRLHLDGEPVQRRAHRRVVGFVVLGLPDVAELEHAPEHVVAAHHRAFRIGDGVELGRRLRQTRDHRELGERELGDGTSVVHLRRGADPVGAMAEEDLVDVELQDFVLGEPALDLQREQDLLELAGVGLLPAEEEVPGHLHGDGAAPRPLLPGEDQVQRRAEEALPVDSGMLVEAVVLTRDERLDHPLGDLIELQRRAELLAELGDDPAVAGQDPQRHLQPHLAKGLGGRKRRGQVQVGASGAEHGGERPDQHEDDECLDCAGESNHGLCSTHLRSRPAADAHYSGFRPSAAGLYAPDPRIR